MISQIGLLVGKHSKSLKIISDIEKNIEEIKLISSKIKHKPKVYFEEWFDPLITSIKWVTEIIEICGGKKFI